MYLYDIYYGLLGLIDTVAIVLQIEYPALNFFLLGDSGLLLLHAALNPSLSC